MTPEINREKIKNLQSSLSAARKYHKDRREHGVKRVDLYYDNVEGDWLENFDDESSENQEAKQNQLLTHHIPGS